MELADFGLDQLEVIAARKEREREEERKEIQEINRLNKMPFHIKIQQKGQEKILQEVEEVQKETFLNHTLKKWKIDKTEAEDLFAEYMTKFLRGEVRSIRQFLIKKGYKQKGLNT